VLAIRRAIEQPRQPAPEIAEYGDGSRTVSPVITRRAIDQFRGGEADRGASIRVPRHVEERGHGYLEDRRPGANCDPYRVCSMLLETLCTNHEMQRA
jgi:glutamine synthetase